MSQHSAVRPFERNRTDAQETINCIASSPKKTPVKAYVKLKDGAAVDFGPDARVFDADDSIPVVSSNDGF